MRLRVIHSAAFSNLHTVNSFVTLQVMFLSLLFTDAGQIVIKEDGKAGEFVRAINDLTAHSGGDCPEYAFQGMLNALGQDPLFGSPMYVFTDADPKDATVENIEEVKLLANDLEVTINFLLTGKLTKLQRGLGFQ